MVQSRELHWNIRKKMGTVKPVLSYCSIKKFDFIYDRPAADPEVWNLTVLLCHSAAVLSVIGVVV